MREQPSTHVSRFFSTANRRKCGFLRRVLPALLLAISILLYTSMSMGGLSAGAIDPADILTLTPAQVSAMIGQTCTAYYLASDGTYKPATLSYWGSTKIQSCDAVGYQSTDYTNYDVCWYTCPYPGDYRYVDTPDPLWIVDYNLHFGNVSYYKGGVGCIFNAALLDTYSTYPVSTFSPYYDIIAGDNISDVISLSGRATNSSYGAQVSMQNATIASFLPFTVEQSASDFYVGSANFCLVSSESGNAWIGFVCPDINSGYTYIGHSEPPTPPISTPGSMSGSGSGVITTDSSGVTGFSWDVTMQMPGYMYSGQISTTTAAAASGIDSVLDDAGAAGDVVASDVSALGDYDTSIIWDGLSALFSRHPQIILVISGLSGISLLGWLLNRYGG